MQNAPLLNRAALCAFVLTTLAVLTACGQGGGGGGVTLASGGQNADPVVLEIPIAYIKRPLPEQASDLRDPLAFNPGAQLWVRDRASTTAEEVDVTAQISEIVAQETGADQDTIAIDIKGLESSFDGKQLIFSARAVPEPVDANLENTTWNLWVFDVETLEASYLIPSRIKRNEGFEAGGAQDIAPHFLPDDRIVFSSTRQITSQARQLNEGRAQIFAALDENGAGPAAVLHVYDPLLRNDEFQQISFNLSHDLDPIVLSTGEIVFSRWNNTATNHVSLYRIDPSGADLSPLYGFNSQNSGTDGGRIFFTQARELDDGRLASVAHSAQPESLGGEIVLIDTANYADYEQGLWNNIEALGPGHESLTETEIRSDEQLSPGGQYGSVYPLQDGTGRLLVTWSACRVIDERSDLADGEAPTAGDIAPCTLQPDNTNIAPPLYGAWVYDPSANTQRPVVLAEEGFLVSEIISAENRAFPDLRPQAPNFNSELAIRGLGQLKIDSVYDLDGVDTSPAGIISHATPGTPPYINRPARFLRIIQPVPLPDDEVFEIPNYAFGVTTAFAFREIAGYVPIEPDGSVTANVPAQRAFSFDVLDSRGRRIGRRHNYWLQLAAGEVRTCSGCHDGGSALPHGRSDSQPESSNPGARALAGGALGFPATDFELLFATAVNETMADTWDFHMPQDNPTAAEREMELAPRYTDQWSGPEVTPDATIQDRDYDPAWTDIPADRSIISQNFDPSQPGRIVINYIDHIQPIWERTREAVNNNQGNPVTTCIGCHDTQGDTLVPAGQLDLSTAPSDIDADHYRSYRELLSPDDELWLSAGDVPANRTRTCTELDENGNTLTTIETLAVRASMQAGAANGSASFFSCFEGGICGLFNAPPLPDNCTEEGGEPIPRTRNTVDHSGLLSEPELHLISEWLDIGAQYFNNPFDSRLID